MALTIKYTITRSEDWKSVAIADNQTQWGFGGEMAKGDVTGISLVVYGTDKNTPIYTVAFTTQERTDFLAGSAVTILMSDSRWFGTAYSSDNFFTTSLIVTGGTTVATQVCFDSYFYIKKIVMDALTSVEVPLESFYEANKTVTGDIASLYALDYLSSTISAARENKWRKVYNFLAWNYNVA